ncbi:MAG: glutaminyl-peptide cyclotransferase, partial [Planctomycetota bacterium]
MSFLDPTPRPACARRRRWAAAGAGLLLAGCVDPNRPSGAGAEPPAEQRPAEEPEDAGVPVYGYEVLAVYPHDPRAFTQGLVYADGGLYESTGQRGESSLRFVELETGKVQRMRRLPRQY